MEFVGLAPSSVLDGCHSSRRSQSDATWASLSLAKTVPAVSAAPAVSGKSEPLQIACSSRRMDRRRSLRFAATTYRWHRSRLPNDDLRAMAWSTSNLAVMVKTPQRSVTCAGRVTRRAVICRRPCGASTPSCSGTLAALRGALMGARPPPAVAQRGGQSSPSAAHGLSGRCPDGDRTHRPPPASSTSTACAGAHLALPARRRGAPVPPGRPMHGRGAQGGRMGRPHARRASPTAPA